MSNVDITIQRKPEENDSGFVTRALDELSDATATILPHDAPHFIQARLVYNDAGLSLSLLRPGHDGVG